MLFPNLLVLTGLLVSSTIANPVAWPDKDAAVGNPSNPPPSLLTESKDNTSLEYWFRDLSSHGACEVTSKGATICSYSNQEVHDYNTAHPDHNPLLRKGCIQGSSHLFCLLEKLE